MEKRKPWLVQLPLIVLWTLAFVITDLGNESRLDSAVLRTGVYPALRRLDGAYGDWRFRMRGPTAVQNKIVIVEIDDRAVSELARWPWHRDAIAVLVLQAMDAGAKVVGLDIAFPEADQRVPDGVVELLAANGLGDVVPQFETDLMLQRIIDLYKERLVLGWMTDHSCRPAFPDEGDCPVTDAGELARLPEDFAKFGYRFVAGPAFDPATTPLLSTPSVVSNLPAYEGVALHAGYLVNGADEPDDIVRRTRLAMMVNGHPHPMLPLEMARVGLADDLYAGMDDRGRLAKIVLARSGSLVPVDSTGTMTINFRGAGYHFPFVGAIDLLGEDEIIPVQHDGRIEKVSRRELFQDAYVLIGVTAMGARDLRHFPFGNNVPGTEGLATILDNILAGDALQPATRGLWWLVFALMTIGAAGFGLLVNRLSALPALLSSLGLLGALVAVDVWWLFGALDIALPSVFLLGELVTLLVATIAVKYIIEERGRRFIRITFSKYLAPSVVDQMLKDPRMLQLGGETRRLTIMMSDLRGFTAMAERMKPAEVLAVLNHYLGTMADIIMDHDGTIDEFIGDAILVIFGAPIERSNDARRAVACSVAMQRAMKGINEHNARLGLPRLEMGIALNTGEVIVGNIGSQKHIKYGVVGSHVNLTARIESNTVGGQILISGSTLDLAGPDVKVGAKQMIIAKGFPEPIAAFEIKGIGGEYNLEVEEVDLGLVPLATPLRATLRVMKGKNEEGPEQAGALHELSALGGVLAIDGEGDGLDELANLKLRVTSPAGEVIEGDIYAKIIKAGTPCTLRFTALPPAFEKLVAETVASSSAARSSELLDGDR